MTATRTETDSFGPLEVPADKYWGAQTQNVSRCRSSGRWALSRRPVLW
jgi:fumarate hydratase class II